MDTENVPTATTDTRPPRRLGYARVSTAGQTEALQLDALRKAGVDAIYLDHGVSGKATSRPRLDAMLADLKRGDTVVTYSLSRLGRGSKHLVELGDRFQAEGIELVSLTEHIDTTTPAGRFAYTMLAALAQMEREITVERTLAGLQAARERGKHLGRPWTLDAPTRRSVALLVASGTSKAEVARSFGVSRATVYRALAEEAAA